MEVSHANNISDLNLLLQIPQSTHSIAYTTLLLPITNAVVPQCR